MDTVSLVVAFLAGLLSFLSPCILPLVPAYLSYITGNAIADLSTGELKRALMFKALGFVFGFSIVFIIMGASASKLGQVFTDYQDLLQKIGGVLIIIMGIHLSGIFKIKWLYRERRLVKISEKNRGLGSVFVGMAFATGWTPCIGPVLAAILVYAGSLETISSGIFLLTFYSLGMAIPFLITALAIGKFTLYFGKFSKYLKLVSLLSGMLLIITGILIFTNKLAFLAGIY